MDDKVKKVIALSLGGLVILGGGAAIGAHYFPKTIETVKTVTAIEVKEVPKEVIKEVKVPVEVVKEVDNANLPTALKFIEDNIDEDISMDYIQFEVDSKIEAEAYVRDNIISLLDDKDLFKDGELFGDYRKSEVSISKLYDPIIVDRDFKNKDLTLKYEVKVKAKQSGEDAIYQYFDVTLDYNNGAFEKDSVEIELH